MSAPGRLRSAALLGGGTVLAALFGVFFQALLANWFGAGAETDAWFMSLSIYAFLAKFLMLTHLKSIALPVYRRLRDRDPGEARTLALRLLVWMGGGVGVLAAIVVLAAPWLVDLLAPGYEGTIRELTVTLVRIRTPALAFLAATTAGLVVLESAHRFGVTVLAQKIVPAALTLVLFLLVTDRFGMEGVGWIGLAGGVGGGLVALVMLVPALRGGVEAGPPTAPAAGTGESAGPEPVGGDVAPSPPSARDELRGIGGQWLRFSGSNAATFVGEWAFRVAASLLPVGLFSAVLYGRMVHDLLHGAVNDAAQTVSLPRFAEAAGPGGRLGSQLRGGLGALAAVSVPAAAFVAVSASWLVAVLFGRGRFLEDGMLEPAAVALRIFVLGFVLQGLNQILFAASFASGRAFLVNRVQIAGHLVRALLLVPAVLAFSYVGLVGAQVAMNALVLLLLAAFAPAGWKVAPRRWIGAAVATTTGRGVLVSTALLVVAWAGAAALLPDPLSLATPVRTGVVILLGVVWFGGYAALASLLGVAPVQAGLRRAVGWIRGRGVLTMVMLLGLAAVAAAPATAQDAPPPADGAVVGGGPLPADHWVRGVVELLEARGALAAGLSRAGPLTGARAEALLEASGAPVARASLLRLRRERGVAGPLGGVAGALRGGYRAVRSGTPGEDGAVLGGALHLGGPGDRLFASVEAEAGGGAARPALVRGGVGVRFGPMALHLGRHRLQLGGGSGGGLVLSSSGRLDGAVLLTEEPFRLPWLGDTHLTAGVFPLGRYESVEDPWFALLRLAVSPSPAVRIGISRAAMVGGYFDGGSPPFDPVVYGPDEGSMGAGDVVGILVGRVTGFDNQLLGVDARVSLAGAGIPVLLHGEIALEDNQRSWGDGALQLGALVAPRAMGSLTVGYEYTGIGDPGRWCAWCDTLPTFWYGHTRFQDGWRAGEELLGHPLGGYGLEHRLEVALRDPGLAVDARAAALRRRRDRWNLLEPLRPGWAWGLWSRARLRLGSRAEVALETELEWGDEGWQAGRATFLLGILGGGGGTRSR